MSGVSFFSIKTFNHSSKSRKVETLESLRQEAIANDSISRQNSHNKPDLAEYEEQILELKKQLEVASEANAEWKAECESLVKKNNFLLNAYNKACEQLEIFKAQAVTDILQRDERIRDLEKVITNLVLEITFCATKK